MFAVIIISIIVLAAFVGLFILEGKLARSPSSKPGLILPGASFLLSLLVACLYVLNSAVGMTMTDGQTTFVSGDYTVSAYSDGSFDAVYSDTGEPVEIYGGEGGIYNTDDGALIASDEQINEIMESYNTTEISSGNIDNSVFTVALPFILFILNIPTIAYLVIYFLTRRRVSSSAQLGKMEIQDI